MAFVSGPRQVGKTTLSKSFKSKFDQFRYYNWDEFTFRKNWTKNPNLIKEGIDLSLHQETILLILDEIHKSKGWKQKVKGLFDTLEDQIRILVTGSARLNVYKKGGDSLMGRYLHFRLHPFSYGELNQSGSLDPEEWLQSILKKPEMNANQKTLSRLFEFSGFPEPYLAHDQKIQRIWKSNRIEKIIKEDIRDLSQVQELSHIEMLVALLPTKVGSLLSVESLREDLEVKHQTVSRWMKVLEELYYHFEIKPWTRSIPRSLKQNSKIYLFDWTEVEGKGERFENMIACHLLKACDFWTDTGEGQFQLYYLRNKEKEEIDFLIVKDKKPWLAIEAKYSDSKIDLHAFKKYQAFLHCPFVQVIFPENHFRSIDSNTALLSAAYFLNRLP